MEQSMLRERLINFIASSGVKQNYISFKTSIPSPTISQFKKHKTDLTSSSLCALDDFLTERGY